MGYPTIALSRRLWAEDGLAVKFNVTGLNLVHSFAANSKTNRNIERNVWGNAMV